MCNERAFVGDIALFTENCLEFIKNGIIVLRGSIIIGVYESLPEIYKDARIIDYRGKIICPIKKGYYFEKSLCISHELNNFIKEGVGRILIESSNSIESNLKIMDIVEKAGLGAIIYNTNYSKSEILEFIILAQNKYDIVKVGCTKENSIDKGFAEKFGAIYLEENILNDYKKDYYLDNLLTNFKENSVFDSIIINYDRDRSKTLEEFLTKKNLDYFHHMYVNGKRVMGI